MGRVAEAIYCILGSLYGVVRNLDDDGIEKFKVEVAHIEEEIGIVENCLNEYSRDLYIERFNNYSDMDDVERVRNQADKLKNIAEKNKRELIRNKDRYEEEELIFKIAYTCYEAIMRLCEGILENVRSIPVSKNVFNYIPLKANVGALSNYCEEYIIKYGR